MVRIVIDDREFGTVATEALLKAEDATCSFQRLEVGDYQVDDRLVVERKTLVDLLASIEDGRLFRQAQALAKGKHRPLIILEGRTADLEGRAWHREAIQGALVTVSLVWGIPLLRALDGEETARLILQAARQLERSALGLVHRPGPKASTRRKVQIRVVQGIPGLGPRLARQLLEAFGSMEALVAASEAQLRQVKGIGPGRARRIRWALGGGPTLGKG